MTELWWKALWQSPMAAEFLDVDVHQLYILAELEDQWWWTKDVNAAKELRMHRSAFGLTPVDRRRLQWEMGKPDDEPEMDNTPPPQDETNILQFLAGKKLA